MFNVLGYMHTLTMIKLLGRICLLEGENIEFKEFGLRDNVAQISVFEVPICVPLFTTSAAASLICIAFYFPCTYVLIASLSTLHALAIPTDMVAATKVAAHIFFTIFLPYLTFSYIGRCVKLNPDE